MEVRPERLFIQQDRRHVVRGGEVVENVLAAGIHRAIDVLQVQRFDRFFQVDRDDVIGLGFLDNVALLTKEPLHRLVDDRAGLLQFRDDDASLLGDEVVRDHRLDERLQQIETSLVGRTADIAECGGRVFKVDRLAIQRHNRARLVVRDAVNRDIRRLEEVDRVRVLVEDQRARRVEWVEDRKRDVRFPERRHVEGFGWRLAFLDNGQRGDTVDPLQDVVGEDCVVRADRLPLVLERLRYPFARAVRDRDFPRLRHGHRDRGLGYFPAQRVEREDLFADIVGWRRAGQDVIGHKHAGEVFAERRACQGDRGHAGLSGCAAGSAKLSIIGSHVRWPDADDVTRGNQPVHNLCGAGVLRDGSGNDGDGVWNAGHWRLARKMLTRPSFVGTWATWTSLERLRCA